MSESRDVAIIGMSCAFPGSPNVREYWRTIRDAKQNFRDVPLDRWDHSAFYSTNPRDTDSTYAKRIAYLDDIRSFAPEEFRMPPRRVRAMDPQQRLVLSHVRLATNDAGYGTRSLPRTTGVYIGASVAEYKDLVVSRLRARQILTGEWGDIHQHSLSEVKAAIQDVGGIQQYSMLGVLLNMIACNVSEAFDFAGPALVMDAACSSALVATHEAVLHLRAGVCDAAVVGGVYSVLTPDLLVGFSRIGALSRSDVCRPFDNGADGFVLGEGVGVVILKRYDDAVRDGDRIRAVIKGAGLSNDGRSDGPMTPRLGGQVECLARAYRDAKLSPDTISYIEAHGSATPVGDATEIGAIMQNAAATKQGKIDCAVASVKGNIGHPLAAAGMAGLIKTVLVLENNVIPRQAGWQTPREALGIEGSGFVIPSEPRPFVRNGKVRRVGVNAFGFGGTNVHVIVEEPPVAASRPVSIAVPESMQQPQLVMVSAASPSQLAEYAETLAGEAPELGSLRDIAHSLLQKPAESARVAFVANDVADLQEKLRRAATVVRGETIDGIFYANETPQSANVAFIFPGDVAQRTQMCGDAYQRFASLRQRIEELADPLDGEIQRPLAAHWTSSDAFDRRGAQPALALMQLGLVDLLAQFGVLPHATLGHGFGALVAATVGGALQSDEVLSLIARRRSASLVPMFERLSVSTARIPVISCSAAAPYPGEAGALARALSRDACAEFALADGMRGLRDAGAGVLVEIGGRPFLETLAQLAALGVPLQLDSLFEGAHVVALPAPPLKTRTFWIIERDAKSERTTVAALVETRVIERAPEPVVEEPPAPKVVPLPATTSSDDVKARVFEIVAKVSSFSADTLSPQQKLGEDLSFDSLMTFELYAALNDTFPHANGLSQSLLRRDTTIEQLANAVADACAQSSTRKPAPRAEGITRHVVQPVDRALVHQPQPAELPFPGRAILVADALGIAPLLRQRIEAAGRDVLIVSPTDALHATANDAVIDLSGLRNDETITASRLRAPVLALLARASSITAAMRPALFATAHCGRTTLGIAGATKSLAKEWPETIVRAIEVASGAPLDSIAANLFAELAATDRTVEVSYASGTRRILGRERAPIAHGTLPDAAVVAISGGGRGLGAKLAIELARRYKTRLLLLGRAPEAEETTRAIRAAGGEALYVSCDVRDAAQVAAAFSEGRQDFGPITHVVHAAGITADEPLTAKTADRASNVLDTKIAGCLALWEASRPDPLSTFLMYGSLAGRFGNAQQFDYSAANHTLGRLASLLGNERRDVRVVTLDLPPWEGSGMVSSLPDAVQRALRDRITFLSDADGLDAVIDELAATGASGEVVLGASADADATLDRATVTLSVANDPWLEDHRIDGHIVVPFAWLADQAATAAMRLGLGNELSLAKFEINGMFTVPPNGAARIAIHASLANGEADVRLEGIDAARKATAHLRITSARTALPRLTLPANGAKPALTIADFYEHHTFHGPQLRALTSVQELGPEHGLAALRGARDPRLHGTAVDILALDGMLQLCAYWASVQIGRIGVPLSADEIRIVSRPQPGAELRAIGLVRQPSGDLLSSDLDLVTIEGNPVIQLRGLHCRLAEVPMISIKERGETAAPRANDAQSRIEDFPEVQALQQRLEMARLAGMRNPYFSLHERVTNSTSVIGGREFVNFSSYNYLGLSGDPDVNAAVIEAVQRYGTSVSASRLASGEKPLHRELEHDIADFLGCEDAIVMVGGHATNVSVIGHLFGPQDLVLHDSLAHDSIMGGIKLSGAKRRPFAHNDCDALERALEQSRGNFRRVLIAVEGVYSMDGDLAPLDRIIALKKRYNAMVLVDEAHSLGVLGATGRGIGETFNVNRADVEMWMGTLSKSLASCGGYIAGSAALVQYLKYSNPGFIYSVGISPANAAAALAALRKMRAHPELVQTLQERSRFFLDLCRERGVDTGFSDGSAVVPCIIGSSIECLRVADALAARAINVQPILYPAVEEHLTRLRFFVTSHHTERQLRETADILAEVLAEIRGGTVAHRAPSRASDATTAPGA